MHSPSFHDPLIKYVCELYITLGCLVCKALKIVYLSHSFSFLLRNLNISQIFAINELMHFPRNFQILNILSPNKLYWIWFISNFILYLIRAIILLSQSETNKTFDLWNEYHFCSLVAKYLWYTLICLSLA